MDGKNKAATAAAPAASFSPTTQAVFNRVNFSTRSSKRRNGFAQIEDIAERFPRKIVISKDCNVCKANVGGVFATVRT
jgi:hypothetical protein